MRCSVWRSIQRPSYYVFCEAESELKTLLPASILSFLVDLECFYSFELDEGKRLVGAEALTVIDSILEKGYFLQIPSQASQEAILI